MVRTDSEAIFKSQAFLETAANLGVRIQRSPAYAHHANGIAERTWRTLQEMGNCMLKEANLGPSMWPYALNHAVFIVNKLPSSATGYKSPYELLTNKTPTLNIPAFGCTVFAYNEKRGKLDPAPPSSSSSGSTTPTEDPS